MKKRRVMIQLVHTTSDRKKFEERVRRALGEIGIENIIFKHLFVGSWESDTTQGEEDDAESGSE